jgi:hypothetical protein
MHPTKAVIVGLKPHCSAWLGYAMHPTKAVIMDPGGAKVILAVADGNISASWHIHHTSVIKCHSVPWVSHHASSFWMMNPA